MATNIVGVTTRVNSDATVAVPGGAQAGDILIWATTTQYAGNDSDRFDLADHSAWTTVTAFVDGGLNYGTTVRVKEWVDETSFALHTGFDAVGVLILLTGADFASVTSGSLSSVASATATSADVGLTLGVDSYVVGIVGVEVFADEAFAWSPATNGASGESYSSGLANLGWTDFSIAAGSPTIGSTWQDAGVFSLTAIAFSAAAAPVSIVGTPRIHGRAVVGETLSVGSYSVTGGEEGQPLVSTYQWEYNDGSWHNGATTSTIVVPPEYLGLTVRCTVSVTDGNTTDQATTAAVGPITAITTRTPYWHRIRQGLGHSRWKRGL